METPTIYIACSAILAPFLLRVRRWGALVETGAENKEKRDGDARSDAPPAANPDA